MTAGSYRRFQKTASARVSLASVRKVSSAGLRIPIYTVGFEADLEELGRVSSLVEAASIDASEDDVEFKIAALFNAGG